MKKAILLAVCALFIGAAAFAQSEDKKPTKEETIKWLTEKLKVYFQPPISTGEELYIRELSFTIEECNIKVFFSAYTKSSKTDTEKHYDYEQNSTYPTNFTEIKKDEDASYNFYYIYYDDKVVVHRGKAFNSKSEWLAGNNQNSWGWFLKEDTPPAMVERITNAIRYLNSLCQREYEPF